VLKLIGIYVRLLLCAASLLLTFTPSTLAWAAWAVALGNWLGLVLVCLEASVFKVKMAIPRFNFTRLLIDLATAHNMPPPIFIPAIHPLPGHHAFVCQYSGVVAIGGGETEAVARNTAARQVWIEMGHLITVDPRCVIFVFSLIYY